MRLNIYGCSVSGGAQLSIMSVMTAIVPFVCWELGLKNAVPIMKSCYQQSSKVLAKKIIMYFYGSIAKIRRMV